MAGGLRAARQLFTRREDAMQKLVAMKPFSYATRRFKVGDEFTANARDARLLIAVGKARDPEVRKPGRLPPPPEGLKRKIEKARL